MVPGDFNDASWRRKSGPEQQLDSTIKDTFKNTKLPVPLGASPMWRPGCVPGEWSDVCGFLKPPDSDRYWKVRKHGVFVIPRRAVGLRDQDRSSHHETWLHLDLVQRWDWSQTHDDKYDQRIQLKERATPYYYGHRKRDISDIMSDNSFSS